MILLKSMGGLMNARGDAAGQQRWWNDGKEQDGGSGGGGGRGQGGSGARTEADSKRDLRTSGHTAYNRTPHAQVTARTY